MDIMHLFSMDSYIMVNKILVHKYGFNEAVILGLLCKKYQYWANREGLTEDGYFYCSADDIKAETTFSAKKQLAAINNLEDMHVISTSLRGIPRAKYFKINSDVLERDMLPKEKQDWSKSTSQLGQNGESGLVKMEQQDWSNSATTISHPIRDTITQPITQCYADSPQPPSEPSVQDVNKSLNKQIDDNIEGTDVKQQIEGTNEESINMNSKAFKNIMMFIDSLSYTEDTKDELKKWYNNVAKGRVSVIQLKDKLDAINQSVKNEDELYVAIHIAYLNNYMAFYPPKKSYNYNNYNTTTSANNVTHSRTLEEIQRERDEIALFMQTGEKF